ncbi:MAG: Ig-like domain-containing protein [Verrucomicrobiota bacterium]
MKPDRPENSIARHFLAATLLTSLTSFGQTIPNPSFEIDAVVPPNGYGAITGWTSSSTAKTGINTTAGPFAGPNNGTIPAGTKAAFIQASGGPASLSTTITGLTPGTKYLLSFKANARSGNTPFVSLTTAGLTTPVVAQISSVGTTAAYRDMAFEFVALTESQEITISNGRTTGDNTLVVDDFTITQSTSAWTFAPWNDDETSGVDSQFVYTHAYNFGSDVCPLINGVPFIGRETGAIGRFTQTDFTTAYANLPSNTVTGASQQLAKDFRYGGASLSLTLDNLKPNTEYRATIYGVGFDNNTTNHRSSTFSSSVPGSQKRTLDLDQYGQGKGMRVEYTYTTDATGTPVTLTFPDQGSGGFHTSGFSNRETTGRIAVPKWTAHEWIDDESSGISGEYLYTHAFNMATAGSWNINGIQFSGNPNFLNGPGYNIGITNIGPTDSDNNITGHSSDLGTRFFYGGSPAVVTLTGLVPGKEYVLTFYSTGWEAPGNRVIGFFGKQGEDPVFLDQNQFGLNNGTCFDYHYTAKPDGSIQVMTSAATNGSASLHYYALSNREAAPRVDTLPTFTLQPTGGFIGVGTDFTLRTGVIGSPDLTYQWYLNDDLLENQTGLDLVLEDVDSGDTGYYYMVATNEFGTVTSNYVDVAVLDIIPGFGTGVNGEGLALENGIIDPHYKLITNPDGGSTDVFVQSPVPGAWVTNTTTSKWIGPKANTSASAAGDYIYQTQMDLTGFTLDTVQITGKWATDNAGISIRVNGVVVPGLVLNGSSFATLQPFAINLDNAPGLINGINTIEFVVNNELVGYTGLRVDSLSAVGALPPNTPPHVAFHPASAALGHNQNYLLSVFASGSATLDYQWYFNDEPIDNATSLSYQITASEPSVAGNYKVRVTNDTGFQYSNVAVITIPNTAPVAGADAFETATDVALEFFTLDLLANDTDANGDTPSVVSVSPNSTGGGTVELDGSFIIYTPASGFSGVDTFTYSVSDGIWGGVTVGTVTVTVIGGETAPPTNFTIVLEGGVMNGTFTGTPGKTYVLQRSETLMLGSWINVDSEVAPPSGIVTVQDPGPLPTTKAFYRISYDQ